MCGIFGYSGEQNAVSIVHNGLKRLEYRGYDSWGIASLQDGTIERIRDIGQIPETTEVIPISKSSTAIGHTRWATHGGVTVTNAHPHVSENGRFAIAHNGIVENYDELKTELIDKSVDFKTETDTEVILKLIEQNLLKQASLIDAIKNTVTSIQGRNTFIVLDSDDGDLFAYKNGSPLLLGKDTNDNLYISSDSYSLSKWATVHYVVDNGELIHFTQNNQSISITETGSGHQKEPAFSPLHVNSTNADKEGFEHYMIKEIYDTPYVLRQLPKLKKWNHLQEAIKNARTVYTIASGTAGLAAAQTAYYLRFIANINAISLVGAEASEYLPLINEQDLLIAPSQSGETADVLEILEIAKEKKATIATYVNMHGSSMERLADITMHANCGPEICVMSTKVFTSQIAWGYLLATAVAGDISNGLNDISELADAIESYLAEEDTIDAITHIAKELSKEDHIFLLGKGQNQSIVKEGMVKIIEGSYVHAHGIPAGDLKHYAITLIEDGIPVIIVLSEDETKQDTLNAAHEVKARGANVIGISSNREDVYDKFIPVTDTGKTSGIFNIIPIQLLAYYIAKELGRPIDKPRNIAKSVTVK